MAYTKQGFYEGMTLEHTHLINMENGILEASGNGKTNINKNIHFVGMSIWWYDGNTLAASGFGGGVKARGYQTLIKECFNFTETYNHCYSGYSLGGTSNSDSNAIMSKASSWSGSQGDIWTLDTITNDFKRNIPIGSVSDYENATGFATYYGALRAFRDRVIELSGDTAIVICSNALRRNNSSYTSTSKNTQDHTLVDYEKALIRVAVLNNWYFVDQYRLSGITDDTITLTTLDGLHLNNFGYTLAVKPWIEQLNIIAVKLTNDSSSEGTTSTNEYVVGYISTTGELIDGNSNWKRTNYIEVAEGQKWKYTGDTSIVSGTVCAVYGYDESMAPVSKILDNVDGKSGLEFTIPAGIDYIACCSCIKDFATFTIEKVS